MAHLSTRQIKQLIEIDNAGNGIKDEVQALIARLTSGGVGVKTDDPREAQAKRLHDRGFGDGRAFATYLETIPEIPETLKAESDRFPELVLVDMRLPITEICELLGIEGSETYVDFDPKAIKTDQVYWIRAQDGRRNNGKSVRTCRESFAEDEVGLTVYEGLALFVQIPNVLKGRHMNLPGSVYRDSPCCVPSLYFNGNGRPMLAGWVMDDSEIPGHDSASRGK